MKVLFILPKINSGCQWNVGLAFMSAVLKKAGHEVALFEFDRYPEDIVSVLSQIGEFKPGIVGIGANSHQFFYAKKIAKGIKEKFKIPVFVGGVHTILKPESINESEFIDGVCLGEGEYSFLELARRIESGENYVDLENFWFRDGDRIIKNRVGSLVSDLDSLPFPDRTIFEYFKEAGKKTPRFIFSRGCPFECTYCCNHAFKKIFKDKGQYLRQRSVDLALSEIETEKGKYDFDHFKLDDDTFSLNKVWMKEFCKKLRDKKMGLSFECNIRPGTIDEEGMMALREAGCRMVKIGIESGDPRLRKSIMNRNFTNEDIVKTFDLAKKFGIKTFSFNIIGVLGETKETASATKELNIQIMPDFMQVTVFYPYTMTVLGDMCFQKGYVKGGHEDSYMERSVLKLPTMSKKEIERAVKNFKFDVYWAYDKKAAVNEKILQLKKFIIKNPMLYFMTKILYKPIKLMKKISK